MSAARRRRRIRRITVTLAGHSSETRALRSVARLARESAAELAGLFMMDADLLTLATLPFAIEISRSTTAVRRVDAAELQHQLQVQAGEAERALAHVAEEAGVPWTFRVARDTPSAALLAAAAETDLIALAVRRGAWLEHRDAGSPRRATAADAAAGPVVVVFDGSTPAEHALELAVRIASAETTAVSVMVKADSEEAGQTLGEHARRLLAGQPARIVTLVQPDMNALTVAVRGEYPGLVVLPSDKRALGTEEVRTLLEAFDCPSLLVL
jgi:hypothetical protein